MKNQVKKAKFTKKGSDNKNIKTISFTLFKNNIDTNSAI